MVTAGLCFLTFVIGMIVGAVFMHKSEAMVQQILDATDDNDIIHEHPVDHIRSK
jgi:hypothetical protein